MKKKESDLTKAILKKKLKNAVRSDNGSKITRFSLALVSGMVPFFGGALEGIANTWSEIENERFRNVVQQWLEVQDAEILKLTDTIEEIMSRLDLENPIILARVQSGAYLHFLKKSIHQIQHNHQEEKRKMARHLLINAAQHRFCTDELVNLFIDWIDRYNLGHFAVLAEIHHAKKITRQKIWHNLNGPKVSENSHEADLFKLVLHDLSLGQLIRQHRTVDAKGNFIVESKKKKKIRANESAKRLKSAFDNEKTYELTALGEKFTVYIYHQKR